MGLPFWGPHARCASVYDAFATDYSLYDDDFDRGHDWDDWDDWDWDDWDDLDWDDLDHRAHDTDYCPEFDFEAFDEDYDLFAEIGLERHIFLFDGKLDIYPGVYLPILIGSETSMQQILGAEQLRQNAGATLGASVRFLRIFRIGMELDAGFANAANGISQSFREGSLVPFKRIPYQTSMTFGLAF
jgi:hypothetical protein